MSRASLYRRRRAENPLRLVGKRGPKTQVSDEELLALIREDLETTEWVGEGHRKVWARLRALKGVRTSRPRVLRLMREAGLLAPNRARRILGPRTHEGTIIPEQPNQMWGTDATAAFTEEDGQVTVFVAVDHLTAECVGIHAAKPGTRYEALEPIHQAVRSRFGAIAALVAVGLSVRHDHGSQYVSDAFQEQLAFLGIESSPAFVRAPEGNGCVERLIRTLKEQLLWLRPFRNVEELRLALLAWAARYNSSWLIECHGFLTPNQAREVYERAAKAARMLSIRCLINRERNTPTPAVSHRARVRGRHHAGMGTKGGVALLAGARVDSWNSGRIVRGGGYSGRPAWALRTRPFLRGGDRDSSSEQSSPELCWMRPFPVAPRSR